MVEPPPGGNGGQKRICDDDDDDVDVDDVVWVCGWVGRWDEQHTAVAMRHLYRSNKISHP